MIWGRGCQTGSVSSSLRAGASSALTDGDLELVRLATELISAREGDDNHTVAAAARDAEGCTFTGLNLYHFTGGPCAELVAMGTATSTTAVRLNVMVAVGDRGRGVIAPCGRCRQVMLDYFPDMQVIVPEGEEAVRVPIAALLPWTYVWQDHQEPHQHERDG